MARKKRSRRAPAAAPYRKFKKSRRRRVGSGAGAFKAVSNPAVGALVGGIAAVLVKNILTRSMAGNRNAEMIGNFAPIIAGLLIRKKAPFVAAGMIAVPAVRIIGARVPMLAEDTSLEESGNTNFVSENLLLSDALVLSDQDFSPVGEPMEEESVFAEVMEEDD